MKKAILIEGKPDLERKNCFDCYYCQAAVTWWCVNTEAAKERGTKFPGVSNCPHWKPVKTKGQLTWYERMFGDFIELKA